MRMDSTKTMDSSHPLGGVKAFQDNWKVNPGAGTEGIVPVTRKEVLDEFGMDFGQDTADALGDISAHEALCSLEAETARMGEHLKD